MRRRLIALVIGALVSGVLVSVAPVGEPAAAAATPLVARMTMISANTNPLFPRSGVWDEVNSGQSVGLARADQLVVSLTGGTADQDVRIDIRLDQGQRFRTGRTLNVPGAYLTAYLETDTTDCGLNWFDIHDLAYDGDQIVRLDLSFVGRCTSQVIGDFQLRPRGSGPVTAVRNLVWPDTPIGTHHPLAAPVLIRNVGSSPVTLGRLQRSGTQVAEFPLRTDGCSERTLRPRDACVVEVGFAPRTPGLKRSVLILTGGPEPVRVDLAGSAPTGRSSWAIRRPQLSDGTPASSYLITDAHTDTYAAGGPDSVTVEFSSASATWSLFVSTKDFAGLRLGTQSFGYEPDKPDQPELYLSGRDLSCAAGSGTMNIKQLEFGPNRELKHFSISIERTCIEHPEATTVAEISYRATDAAPTPAGPYVLRTGQSIWSGATLRTFDGVSFEARLRLGSNGQVVSTDRSGTIWKSPYRGSGRGYRLGVLVDGSVAITDRSGRSVWRQRPAGMRPGDFLLLQSDGNLVLYTPDYHPLWSALLL